MNIEIKKKHFQPQLMVLLGPMLMGSILLVTSIRSSPTPFEIPFVAFVGLLLSYCWKWRGLCAALFILAGAFLYQPENLLIHNWVWNAALFLAMTSVLVMTTLSLEESWHAWDCVYQEKEDHRQAFAATTERYQLLHTKIQIERQELVNEIERVQSAYALSVKKNDSQERLVALARDELKNAHLAHETLIKELYAARQEVAALEIKLEKLQPFKIQGYVDDTLVREITSLKEFLTQRESEIQRQRQQIEEADQRQCLLQDQFEKSNAVLSSERNLHLNEKKQFSRLQEDFARQQIIMQKLTDQVAINSENTSKIISESQHKKNQIEQQLKILEVKIEQELTEKNHFKRQSEQLSYEINDFLDQIATSKQQETEFHEMLNQASERLNELHNHSQMLKNDLLECQREEQNSQAKICKLETLLVAEKVAKEDLEGRSEELLSELEIACTQLSLAKEQEFQFNKQIKDVACECQELKDQCNGLKKQLAHFEQVEGDFRKTYDQLLVEKDELCRLVKQPFNPDDNMREIRRLQGLYQQLRCQFAEKTETLDNTRKDLFLTQEKLAALQKEIGESEDFGHSEIELSLIQLLAETEIELEEHYQEIENLQHLVNALMNA